MCYKTPYDRNEWQMPRKTCFSVINLDNGHMAVIQSNGHSKKIKRLAQEKNCARTQVSKYLLKFQEKEQIWIQF